MAKDKKIKKIKSPRCRTCKSREYVAVFGGEWYCVEHKHEQVVKRNQFIDETLKGRYRSTLKPS